MTKLTVIMPVYNTENFLHKSIESVLNQTLGDFEFIIINDGSTDSSLEILNYYSKKDSRIKIINQSNAGASKSFNNALNFVQSPLIARMDSDDICYLNRFKLQYNFLNKYKDISALGGSVKLIDENDNILKNVTYPRRMKFIKEHIQFNIPIAFPAMMIRTDVLKKFNGLRSITDPADDYDLWLRLIDGGKKISNLKNYILLYRIREDSLSSKKNDIQSFNTIASYLSSKLRKLGKEDIISNLNKIDQNFFNYIPKELHLSDLEKFEYHNLNISNQSIDLIKSKIKKLKNLINNNKSELRLVISRIFFRACIGFFKSKSYFNFIKCIFYSLYFYPSYIPKILKYRMHLKFLI